MLALRLILRYAYYNRQVHGILASGIALRNILVHFAFQDAEKWIHVM